VRTVRPRYRGAERRWVDDPLIAVPARPEVDLNALALMFSAPALVGEFAPQSFWRGVERHWERPQPATDADVPLEDAFAGAVEDLCADAGVVGVMVSGGLDSLAVLAHVCVLRPTRRLVAYTVGLVDDNGVAATSVVRKLLQTLCGKAELVVVSPTADAVPAWSPHGPRLDALPGANAAIAMHAASEGVDVLLSGAGADELLGVPRFATARLLRRRGPRTAARYAFDGRRAGPGMAGEVLSAASGWLPSSWRARCYWAVNWPELCAPDVAEVVPEPLRTRAANWAREWISAAVDAHAEAGRSWVDADAYDAFWPRSYVPPAGPVAEASPFLHERFVQQALALPIEQRYDAAAPTAYWRCKAAVVRLLPTQLRALAPTRKQYFTRALSCAVAEPIVAPLAAAAGLIDPDRLAATPDVAVRMMVSAVEQWLAGARAAGAAVPGVSTGSAV